jgi:tetratricopeptide (TPR) repeat protein
MKFRKMKKVFILFISLVFCTACDKFLDELPDNRAEVNNVEKVAKLLVSAYPDNSHTLIAEMASDNVDDYKGPTNSLSSRFIEQVAQWQDVTETDNEDPKSVWESHYMAIANANQALAAIEEIGEREDLLPYKGEALLARAYSHFILVNLFSLHYNKKTSDKDLGIPYMDHAETELNPKYDRGTVAQVYEAIEQDLEIGLPLIKDVYEVPKYHFNQNAAYAFASRFYLFYEKYDKVIECANKVLGSDPAPLMRDWATASQKTYDFTIYAEDYISATHKCNFLMTTGYSNCGLAFGPWTQWKRFSHTRLISNYETLQAPAPWGTYNTNTYYYTVKMYGSNGGEYSFACIAKIPYIFEYTDPVAQIGYRRAVFPLFQAEEVLLNRAEAYVLTNKFDEAVADLVTWQQSRIKSGTTMTRSNIDEFFGNVDYYDPEVPTNKRKLNPLTSTPIVAGGEQENLLHCVLFVRRIQTLYEGLRWFDVKRYGIEICRRQISNAEAGGLPASVENVYDILTIDDPRRAMQLPQDVIDAGLTENPRKKK